MDIRSLSVVASQAKVQDQASMMMMKKALDASKDSGQAMIDLLSAGPRLSPSHLGQTVDISA